MPLHVPVRPAAGLLLLAVAGCGAATHHTHPDVTPHATTASPTPTPTPTAADGRDLKACADGNCEVELTGKAEIPVGGYGGVDTLSVKKITAKSLHLVNSGDGGSGTSEISPGCVSLLYKGGSAIQCNSGGAASAPERIHGVLSMQVVSLDEHSAILRLAAGAKGDPPSSIAPHIDVPTLEPPDLPDFG